MSLSRIEVDLISEVGLNLIQVKVYLLITCYGKMSSSEIGEKLEISQDEAKKTAETLVNLGAFINYSATKYEAMHPRFTAVNMYRRMCESKNVEFKRNKIVDGIGVILEKPYDDARTK